MWSCNGTLAFVKIFHRRLWASSHWWDLCFKEAFPKTYRWMILRRTLWSSPLAKNKIHVKWHLLINQSINPMEIFWESVVTVEGIRVCLTIGSRWTEVCWNNYLNERPLIPSRRPKYWELWWGTPIKWGMWRDLECCQKISQTKTRKNSTYHIFSPNGHKTSHNPASLFHLPTEIILLWQRETTGQVGAIFCLVS